MSTLNITPKKKISGIFEVPPDKSISHRAVMLGAIANGTTEVNNFLMGDDCIHTIEAFEAMGVNIDQRQKTEDQRPKIVITGIGLRGLKKPGKELYLGNSGTTMRILLGILAGQDFDSVLTGDESLSKRPMKRVVEPLRLMGAEIGSRVKGQGSNLDEIYPPLQIKGRYPLRAIDYKLPIASAQVKSAILLAGLYTSGETRVTEPVKSRDHTERMLKEFGASIKISGCKAVIQRSELKAKADIFIPGDISSAAFFIAAALILDSSDITIKNIGINPTRTGMLDVLKDMGADIRITNIKEDLFEPIADVCARSSSLKGVAIKGEIIPRLIDELPILMVVAAFAKGVTSIKGAGELRVKETDRIASMATNLKKLGADIHIDGDDIIINGKDTLKGATVDSFGDHRTAMSLAVAGLKARGETIILNTDCIDKSFPGFGSLLNELV